MTPLYAWAKRHGVSAAAMEELRQVTGEASAAQAGHGEAAVQSRVRLRAHDLGGRLWRNNVGALLDARGVPVRYGLANESPAMNRALKSSDLVGWRRVLVTPDMLGSHVAIFWSVEVKESAWRYTGTPREKAQLAWINLVTTDGGLAQFSNDTGALA